VKLEAGGGPCVLGFEFETVKRAPTGNPFGGNWGGGLDSRGSIWIFLTVIIIDQSEAWVGSECTLNAINPNASKKPPS
jgi:hypothetical protein